MAYWLTQINPLIDFTLSAGGELTFGNAAEQAGVASAASGYRVQWRVSTTPAVLPATSALTRLPTRS